MDINLINEFLSKNNNEKNKSQTMKPISVDEAILNNINSNINNSKLSTIVNVEKKKSKMNQPISSLTYISFDNIIYTKRTRKPPSRYTYDLKQKK